jgi:hypothetical protein
VPEVGECTDDVRFVYAPVAAERPHRVANARFARCTGVLLSACGGQSISDSTAEDLRTWQAAREPHQTQAVREALAAGDGGAELRVEIALDGVTAHIDGRWPQPQVATILVRQLEPQAEEPTLGAILARRAVCILGTAEELAVRIQPALQEAGWERLPIGDVLGAGAPWIWNVADVYCPGVRQPLDYHHRWPPGHLGSAGRAAAHGGGATLLEPSDHQCAGCDATKYQPQARTLLCAMPYAESQTACEELRAQFVHRYRSLAPKAVERLLADWARLVTFYQFPREHWRHLRTTNVVESPFAAVRLRTTAAKRFKKVDSATAIIWKMLQIAETTFRRLNAPALLPAVYGSARDVDGVKQAVDAAQREVAA